MSFEVFNKRVVPPKNTPAVTIQRKGVISLNRSAHVELGSPEAVELLYDPENRMVALRGVGPEVGHAYTLRTQNGRSFLLSGMAFTKYYDINTDVSRRYVARMNDDMLCIDLKDEGVEVTSNRSSAGRDDAPIEAEDDEVEEDAVPR